jgi:hypothetical protein
MFATVASGFTIRVKQAAITARETHGGCFMLASALRGKVSSVARNLARSFGVLRADFPRDRAMLFTAAS